MKKTKKNKKTKLISPYGGKLINLSVDSVTLDKLILNKKIVPPDVMKIDVEGGESKVLAGAKNLLAEYKPKILLAVHNPKQNKLCKDILVSLGYFINSFPGAGEFELIAEFKKNF